MAASKKAQRKRKDLDLFDDDSPLPPREDDSEEEDVATDDIDIVVEKATQCAARAKRKSNAVVVDDDEFGEDDDEEEEEDDAVADDGDDDECDAVADVDSEADDVDFDNDDDDDIVDEDDDDEEIGGEEEEEGEEEGEEEEEEAVAVPERKQKPAAAAKRNQRTPKQGGKKKTAAKKPVKGAHAFANQSVCIDEVAREAAREALGVRAEHAIFSNCHGDGFEYGRVVRRVIEARSADGHHAVGHTPATACEVRLGRTVPQRRQTLAKIFAPPVEAKHSDAYFRIEDPPPSGLVCRKPKCRSEEVYWWQRQLRSGDEGMTVFYMCQKCFYEWRQR